MTILGAFHCGDSLLIGADSKASDGLIPQTIRKLTHRDDPYVEWWFSGSESLGLLFGNWLKKYEFGVSMDWIQFAEKAKNKVGELNKERLENAGKLRIAPEHIRSQLISALLVGYLHGEPEILEIDDQ